MLLRLLLPILNGLLRLSGREFRVYFHRTEDVVARIETQGLTLIHHDKKLVGQVLIFERPSAA